MATIRKSQIGVVYVHVHSVTYRLRAGEEVPSGADIDPRFLEGAASTVAGEKPGSEEAEAPAGNASRGAWAEFLTAQGIAFPADAKQKDLRALWAAHSTD